MRAEALDGLEQVEAAAWDDLLSPGGGGLRHAFLRAWERCELPGLRSRPIVVAAHAGEKPLAAAAAYVFDLDLASVAQLAPHRLLDPVRRSWPGFMVARVLELGAPVAAVHPLLLASGTDALPAAEAVLDTALAEAEALGAALTVVQDYVPPDSALATALRARGFAALRTLPTAVLDRQFDSYEAYLSALRSRYRNRVRRIMRDSAHLRVERVEDFSALAREFSTAWRLVHDRATETRREILDEAFFSAAAAVPDVFGLVLRRPDDSIAAFGLLLQDAPWLHFLHCGFAEEAGRNEAAYFRLLQEVIRSGVDGRFRLVHLGCTTLGPKLDVGAVPVPLYAWIRHRNPVIQLGCRVAAARSRRRPIPPPPKVFSDRAGDGSG